MFSDYFGGMRAALLQEKNARDYTRRTTHFSATHHDSRASGSGLGRERGPADARRRTSDMADDAVKFFKKNFKFFKKNLTTPSPRRRTIILSHLVRRDPQSLRREGDPLLGLRDEVGHGLVEDVLLVR